MIPLLGDAAPERPKTPAVEWKAYQSRRASESDFLRWFRRCGFQAIGLVTGRISNLMVLDFDDPALYHAFCAQHPDLAELQVIQTRRGYHIYYHLPPHLHVQTRKGQGIDLLANGCYVVARPTVIAGFAYRLVKGGQPKVLTQQHINRINQFLDAHEPSPLTPARARGSTGRRHSATKGRDDHSSPLRTRIDNSMPSEILTPPSLPRKRGRSPM